MKTYTEMLERIAEGTKKTRNATTDFLRKHPVPASQMVKPVKKGVAEEVEQIDEVASHAELAALAHKAYIAATSRGNGVMANHYLERHNKHKALASKEKKQGVAEGYWADALKKTEADRKARKGEPFEKNPASHDKDGVYVGDKDVKIIKPKMNKEEYEQMDEDAEQVQEVLDPSMGAGEYIKDFQKSDAPQFKGKSKEKKRMMGIAAYLQAKRDVKEEVEQMDEAPLRAVSALVGYPKLNKKIASKGTPGSEDERNKAAAGLKRDRSGLGRRAYTGDQHYDVRREEIEIEEGYFSDQDVQRQDKRIASAKAKKAMTPPFTPDKKSSFKKPVTKTGNLLGSAGMDRAKALARMAMQQKMKEEFDVEIDAEMADSLVETILDESIWLESEQIDERNKANALLRKLMDASRGRKFKAQSGTNVPDPEPEHKTAKAHNKAIGRAIRNMSEDVDFDDDGTLVAEKVSYSDFLRNLQEIKLSDLPIRKIPGRSYGSQKDKRFDDETEDEDKPKAPAPAVKRGPGRPTGSKSGANNKVSSGRKTDGPDYTGFKLHLPNTNKSY